MTIFDELKSVANVFREADKIPQYQQIVDVLKELTEMQSRILTLEIENKELKDKLKLQVDLIHENNAYWIKQEGKNDGPFCSRCWDVEKNTVRMKPCVNNPAFHSCPECKEQFQTDSNYHPIFASASPPSSIF